MYLLIHRISQSEEILMIDMFLMMGKVGIFHLSS